MERRSNTICFDNFRLNVYFLGCHRTEIAVRDAYACLLDILVEDVDELNPCPCLLKVSKDKTEPCDYVNRVAHIWNLTVLPCGFSVVTLILPLR